MQGKKPAPTVDYDDLENALLMLGGPYSDAEWCEDNGLEPARLQSEPNSDNMNRAGR